MSYSPGSGGGGGTIGSSGDVALNTPSTGQYLGYNGGVQKWQNFARPLQLVESVYTNTNAGATETIADVSSYTISVLTLTTNCTLTFPTIAIGKTFMIALRQDPTGGRTVTWPGNVLWPGGTAPTLSTDGYKYDVFSFICLDGASWYGFTGGKAF